MKICMLSTVHSGNDVRIVEKESRALADAGHDVAVVARMPVLQDLNNLKFLGIKIGETSRWLRPWIAGRAAMKLVGSFSPAAVHFHDPELIPFAMALKRRGCKVVYDVHENVPDDIYSKDWIPGFARAGVSRFAEFIERVSAARCDAVVAATPKIAERFRAYGARVVLVRNSVRLDEFANNQAGVRRRQAVYVGKVSFNRGLFEMVEGCGRAGLPLVLAGRAEPAEAAWLKTAGAGVEWKGEIGRAEVASLLEESSIGLCLLHDEPNFIEALPTKIFEYMAAGLPIISTDLPISRKIVQDACCGVIIPVNAAGRLADALMSLDADDKRRFELGEAGRRAVSRDYNWQDDAAELIKLYADLSSTQQAS